MPACRMDWVYTGLGSNAARAGLCFGVVGHIRSHSNHSTLHLALNSFLTIQVTCLDVHLKLMPGANEVLILFLAVGH